MRIGMMADMYKPFISGVTSYIALYKRAFENAGHEVYVFTFGRPNDPQDERNIIRSPGLPTFVKGVYGGLVYSQTARRLLQTMDIAHVHHPTMSGILAARYCRPAKIPIVFTNHTRYDSYGAIITDKALRRAYMKILRFYMLNFYRKVDLVIVPTAGAKQVMIPFGLPKDARVVPHGLDLSLFRSRQDSFARKEFGFSSQDVVLIYIGRLGLEKNLPFLIQSFKEALQIRNNLALILVGDGPVRRDLQRAVLSHGISERVCFVGETPHEKLPAYYRLGDIFVMPSTNETFGFTLVEAMACGLPVVAMDVPGIRDNVEPGVTGLLALPESGEFTARLLELTADADLRCSMGRRACLAAEKYSIERSIPELLSIYNELIEVRKQNSFENPD